MKRRADICSHSIVVYINGLLLLLDVNINTHELEERVRAAVPEFIDFPDLTLQCELLEQDSYADSSHVVLFPLVGNDGLFTPVDVAMDDKRNITVLRYAAFHGITGTHSFDSYDDARKIFFEGFKAGKGSVNTILDATQAPPPRTCCESMRRSTSQFTKGDTYLVRINTMSLNEKTPPYFAHLRTAERTPIPHESNGTLSNGTRTDEASRRYTAITAPTQGITLYVFTKNVNVEEKRAFYMQSFRLPTLPIQVLTPNGRYDSFNPHAHHNQSHVIFVANPLARQSPH